MVVYRRSLRLSERINVYNQRIARLRDSIEHPLLVTYLPNIRDLTGFTGSNAFVFISEDRFVFITDGRYAELGELLK